jgi:hypothetical protein
MKKVSNYNYHNQTFANCRGCKFSKYTWNTQLPFSTWTCSKTKMEINPDIGICDKFKEEF